MKQLNFIAIISLLVMAGACGGSKCEDGKCDAIALETSTAALNATESIEGNLTDLGEMLAFLEESELMLDALGMFEATEEVCAPLPEGEEGEYDCWDEPVETEMDTDLSELAGDIAQWLAETVFVDSQLESDGSSLVYLLDPALFCEMDGEDDDSDVDECKDLLTKVPIRVQVTSYSAGDLDIDVLFGEAKLDPIDLQLYGEMLGIEVDLAVTRAVAQLYIDAFGDEEMDAELPTTFKGVIGLRLEKLNSDQFRLTYSVEEAVEVGMTIDGDEFAAKLGKSTFTMTADGAAKAVSMEADIGALDVTFPYQAFINAMWDDGDEYDEGYAEYPDEKPAEPYDDIMDGEAPSVTGNASLHIAGFSGAATFSGDSESLTIEGLGLGSSKSTFKRNNDTLLSVNLNSGGTFDLDIAVSDAEELVLTVAPQFELAVMMAFAAIEADLEELPAFMADDTLSVTLAAAPKPSIKFVEDAIMVVAGELSLASTAFPGDSVTVTTGQCLHAEEDEDVPMPGDEQDPLPEEQAAGHELLSSFYAGECQ